MNDWNILYPLGLAAVLLSVYYEHASGFGLNI